MFRHVKKERGGNRTKSVSKSRPEPDRVALSSPSSSSSSCLFCSRNHRRCFTPPGESRCSECVVLYQICHQPKPQQNLHQIFQEKQQLCLKRCSLSGDLVTHVAALELCPSVAETRRILGRLLEEMAQVEERACQLEMEESRLWEKELNAGGGLLAQEVGDGYVQERLGDFSGGLDSAFAFPWTD